MKQANDGSKRVLLMILTLIVWEAAVRGFDVPQFILPTPSAVAVAFYNGFSSGIYFEHIWVTVGETFLGFLFGSAIAFVLGTLIAMSRRLEYFLYPYVVMFQSMPKVALAPLIVLWFGLGLTSKVINAALVAFFPLMVNVIVGLRSVDEDRINLMRSLGANELQIFRMLRLPNALPFIMAGLEIAMIFALIGAIVAEFVGAQNGLGVYMQSLNYTLDVAGEVSVLLILSVIGLCLNQIIQFIKRRVLFWDPSMKAEAQAAAGPTTAAAKEQTAI
jgi:NitT/TauT family transport system permease protein